MKVLSNIGCFLIGWDKKILNECGEASYRQYRKLLSAICIMMVLWGTIGFCFADRYINIESYVLKTCVSVAFMFIVLCVERVIILTVGKARLMSVMRVLLALCMAVLGSCIFDQIIFRNDIQQAIQEHREDLIEETIKKRLTVYHSQTSPLIDWYKQDGKYQHINGLGELDRIFADICAAIDKVK